MQNKIYFFSNVSRLKNLFSYQIIFLTSLSGRVYVVKDIMEQSKFSFFFDSFDKTNLAFNLVGYFTFPLSELFTFQFQKRFGLSYNLSFSALYNLCLVSLFNLSLSPILEAKSYRFYFEFKPYVASNDFLFYVYENLISNKHLNFFFFTKVFSVPSTSETFRNLLITYIPLPKLAFSSWVNFYAISLMKADIKSIFYSFFEFVFLGLVCFGNVNFRLLIFVSMKA